MSEAWLLIETSTRVGQVGIAIGESVVSVARLDPNRRQNRDLAPTVNRLLSDNRLSVSELAGVMVSQGPGSFTGLRVGIMSAKVLAYATSCKLVAVPTFDMLAARVSDADEVIVLGDALRGQVYVQRFLNGEAVSPLTLQSLDQFLKQSPTRVTGPGLTTYADQLGGRFPITERTLWEPDLTALFQAGWQHAALNPKELFALEPLYIRASSAEEKAAGMA